LLQTRLPQRAALAMEAERQDMEFRELLRDMVRRHSKMRDGVRSDRDIDIGPPQVHVVQLNDHKGLMLYPPNRDGGYRVLPKKSHE
jgi:hypothetical protein